MSNVYRILINGNIDDQKINEVFVFAYSDKGKILDSLQKAMDIVSFTDINGKFFSINFNRTTVVSLTVTEIVNG